jgi:DeoR/GlpR family transcriptional regulator of sugar metabolism
VGADSTKFHRRSLSVIAWVEAVHKLITDTGATAEALANLRARNIDVIVV